MKKSRKYLLYILCASLCFLTLFICYNIFPRKSVKSDLKVVFLDIGQGDAIYIEAPNGRQMLVDSGRDARILSKLSKVMPYGDRSLDIIIFTNPDADHIGGFESVLDTYKVDLVLESGTKSTTQTYRTLSDKIKKQNIKDVLARSGMKIFLDQDRGIYFDILFPDRDVSLWERNDGSVVGRLVYKESSFMLMGDATKYTELLISQNKNNTTLESDVLKLGHHGSHTSSSSLWLQKVKPKWAIISAGKNNRYGHPHADIISRLKNLAIPYLVTYEEGDIKFVTDGVDLEYLK